MIAGVNIGGALRDVEKKRIDAVQPINSGLRLSCYRLRMRTIDHFLRDLTELLNTL